MLDRRGRLAFRNRPSAGAAIDPVNGIATTAPRANSTTTRAAPRTPRETYEDPAVQGRRTPDSSAPA